MKEKYEIDHLLVGNIYSISGGDEYGPTSCESDVRFIFEKEKVPFRKKFNYREIFTGAKMKMNADNYSEKSYFAYFDTWYIVNPVDLSNYLTKEETDRGFITNFRLLEIYNQMNFEIMDNKLQSKVKVIK